MHNVPLTAFHTRPHDNGYRIATARDRAGAEVAVIAPVGPTFFCSRVVQLPDDAFATFCSTCCTAEGALAFATQHGPLGLPADPQLSLSLLDEEHLGCGEVERVEDWLDRADAMHLHLLLGDALQKNRFADIKRLVDRLIARQDPLLPSYDVFVPPPDRLDDDHIGAPLSEFAPLPGSLKPILVTRQDSDTLIALWNRWRTAPTTAERNSCLREYGWALLGFSATAQQRRHGTVPGLWPVRSRTRGDDPQDRLMLAMLPTAHSLVGALWLQVVTAFTGTIRYRFCDGCGKIMTLHPDAGRSNRRTCTPACRTSAHRRKHRAAHDDLTG